MSIFFLSYGNNREPENQENGFPSTINTWWWYLDTYTVILDVQVSYQSIQLRTPNYSIVILYR